MRDILRREAEAVLSIPVSSGYADAVALIVEHVNRRGGKLITSGMGKAGQIAMNIATTFCSTGTRGIPPSLRSTTRRPRHHPAR